MGEKIFTIGAQNQLTEMSRTPFDDEDIFQKLLADHPAILTGSTETAPLLIKRELGVPGTDGGSNRWSLDHLYVDDQGVPILVEVKRASDTRLRREVVGQMLDYAANGSAYWTRDSLIAAFEATCTTNNSNAADILSEFIAEQFTNPEAFWDAVAENLATGRIRMLFVADSIPPELERIILFLAAQLRFAEIEAVRVDHFVGSNGVRVLVPTAIRLPSTNRQSAGNRSAGERKPTIDVDTWILRLAETCGEEKARATRKLVDWHRQRGGNVSPSTSQDSLSLNIATDDGTTVWPFFVRLSTGGRFELSLSYLKSRPRFNTDEKRLKLLEKFVAIRPEGLKNTGHPRGWPNFPVEQLLDERVWSAFTEVADWTLSEAKVARI